MVEKSVRAKFAHTASDGKGCASTLFHGQRSPFADGCKRIAAASFLTFLAKNRVLNPRLSSPVLVAVTLLTAESNPKNFKSIIKVIAKII